MIYFSPTYIELDHPLVSDTLSLDFVYRSQPLLLPAISTLAFIRSFLIFSFAGSLLSIILPQFSRCCDCLSFKKKSENGRGGLLQTFQNLNLVRKTLCFTVLISSMEIGTFCLFLSYMERYLASSVSVWVANRSESCCWLEDRKWHQNDTQRYLSFLISNARTCIS